MPDTPIDTALAGDETLAQVLLAAAGRVGGVLQGKSLAALPAAASAQTHELVYGTLRRFGWGDRILAELMPRPPSDPLLRALLLVALYRLDTRPDLAHAVVHQAVEAAGRVTGGRFRGLVNAVLRNAQRRHERLSAALQADEVARSQHPGWWLRRLRAAYPREWEKIVAAGNALPSISLRVNRRRADAAGCQAALAAVGVDAEVVGKWCLRLDRPRAVEALPGFAEGWWSVQDVAAQRAAPLLDVAAGQRVLDACAAPGGKTAHLAELADLRLLAVEQDAVRARRIGENLARLGLAAEVMVADAGRPARWWDGVPFDRILLDAPCTASGVVSRHPDGKWLRRPQDLGRFAAQQARLLEALWPLLAAGGKLLYATCSVFPEENRLQIERFLAGRSDARALPIAGGSATGLQLLPDGTQDGFFYALLAKAG